MRKSLAATNMHVGQQYFVYETLGTRIISLVKNISLSSFPFFMTRAIIRTTCDKVKLRRGPHHVIHGLSFSFYVLELFN
jgi:hypothetical protein